MGWLWSAAAGAAPLTRPPPEEEEEEEERLIDGTVGGGETGATTSGEAPVLVPLVFDAALLVVCEKEQGSAVLNARVVAQSTAANRFSESCKQTRAPNFSVVAAAPALVLGRN